MNIVEKWVAGFWLGELIVAKAKFRETEKSFILDKCPEYQQAKEALGCASNYIRKDQDKVHDTWEEALDQLHSTELGFIQSYRKHIERGQDRLSKIDDFELTSD